MLLHGAQLRDLDRAGDRHPAEVVADQVDDHHVLGVVLGQQPGCGGSGSLDRAGLHDVALAPQEQLRRGTDHRYVG
jgi:hypothetical protein